MIDYQKYINALRKCANEHEFDWTSTGHIIVSDLCNDTANLLEELSSSEKSNKSEIPNNSTTKNDVPENNVGKIEPTNDLAVEKIIDEIEKEFEKVDIPIMDKLTLFAKVQNALYKCAVTNSEIPNNSTTKNDLPHCQHTDSEIAKSFREDVEAVKDQLPCGEQMDFPDTFDEFANDYGFRDKDEIYTNGSELIPVFRVKQWLEHISTTKNDLGVDWESYKDVDGNSLDDLILEVLQNNFDCGNTYGYKVADEIIALLPSVTPQEPRWISVEE